MDSSQRPAPAAHEGPQNGKITGPGRPSGLQIRRRFTRAGEDVFATVEWTRRDAQITGEGGATFFEQKDIEVPASWSQLATNVVASKYFRGELGTEGRESSIRQLIGRVVETITGWGRARGYFAEAADAEAFSDELCWLLLHQYGCFNSPVWFNVGVVEDPQCSACFINSVEDSMASILDLAKTEGMLFKFGSGTGTNLSSVRSSREILAGGGTASGPVSFMRGFDAFAGVIKSGGRTRRAAKMVILDTAHPDIREFARCKADEEKKAWALIDAGYDGSFGGEAYNSVFFQNSNNSVRADDAFMRAVEDDSEWVTRAVTDGREIERFPANALWQEIIDAAWLCGDPGLQFDSTIQGWHTCPTSGRINASNPCSEYMFLDDTACNLASLNLMKFQRQAPGEEGDGAFDVDAFRHAVDVFFTAMEIIVGEASYPTSRIAENSRKYRPLGLGYANLGALLMSLGLPYDSDAGREFAAAVTALLGGEAYLQSARLAEVKGAFDAYRDNEAAMLQVIARHRAAAGRIDDAKVPAELLEAAREAWAQAEATGRAAGFRNSQATVLAPTGTIGFMMDCDTTGVEPDIALVKYKRLSGGGMMKIVNRTVPLALRRLGYDDRAISDIVEWVDAQDTIEGAPALDAGHLPVFDCAFRPAGGERFIHHLGHVRMMAAVQPFLSGAISKTVNLPENATPEEIGKVYQTAWRLGLKAIAVYRDGCKRTQPLSTKRSESEGEGGALEHALQTGDWPAGMTRRRMPDEREAVTHKFSVGGHEGYITAGKFEDGSLGEIFIVMSKEGSTVSGLMDGFATAISLALQYGVPLEVLVRKFSHMRFEPSGFTGNREIPMAKSIMDYIFRWLALKFLPAEQRHEYSPIYEAPAEAVVGEAEAAPSRDEAGAFIGQADAPPCSDCGAIMVRNGACYKCWSCGATSGCS